MKSHSVVYVRGAVWAMLAWALCGVVGSAAAQDPLSGLQSGIGTLPLLGRGRTRSISAETLQRMKCVEQ